MERLTRERDEAVAHTQAAEVKIARIQSSLRQLLVNRKVERYAQSKFKSPQLAVQAADRRPIKIEADGTSKMDLSI